MAVTFSQSAHFPVLNNAFSISVAGRQPATITPEERRNPPAVKALGPDLSRWCLVASIAAIGMRAQLKELVTVGVAPILLMPSEPDFSWRCCSPLAPPVALGGDVARASIHQLRPDR
jgi:hypothetical protein